MTTFASRLAVAERRYPAPPPPLSPCDPCALATAAHIAPDPWQADVLTSTAPRLLLNCSRQSGKSSIVAVLAVHTALYAAPALVLLLSPGLRQSAELFRKVATVYAATGRRVPAEAESVLRLELANGSRIEALPGSEATVRGYSGVDLLVFDEASRVADPLYFSTRPMLAVSGGRLIALSTPFGTRGWWWDAWEHGEGWQRVRVPATECPRIAPTFLVEEAATLGEWWYRQEYCCEFMDAEDAVFRQVDIDAAMRADVLPLFAGLR
jgi:hypothetical protein